MTRIEIIKHCSVGYASARQMIESIAGDLPASYGYVITSGSPGIEAKLTQGSGDHCRISGELTCHIIAIGYERKHKVLAISEDSASAASAAHNIDTVVTAIMKIHFLVYFLISATYHCRINLPGKEIITRREKSRHPFLGCKKERQSAVNSIDIFRKCYMSHNSFMSLTGHKNKCFS